MTRPLRLRRAHIAALAVAGAGALAAAGFAGLAPTTETGVKGDIAFGVGTFGPGCTQDTPPPRPIFCTASNFTVRLLALAGPNGFRVHGFFERRNNQNGNTFSGPITCLNVQGKTASIGGVVTRTPSPTGEGTGVPYLVYVVDNGPPGSATPDLISPFAVLPPGDPDLAFVPPNFPDTCPSPASIYGYFPLTSGDITVQDDT
ncbi:MAG: hypothetical protein ACRDN6_11850 [Gaiellaceae bacterium]